LVCWRMTLNIGRVMESIP